MLANEMKLANVNFQLLEADIFVLRNVKDKLVNKMIQTIANGCR